MTVWVSRWDGGWGRERRCNRQTTDMNRWADRIAETQNESKTIVERDKNHLYNKVNKVMLSPLGVFLYQVR